MAVITYNGVQLSNCLTHSVDFEPVWTPDGVDYIWTLCTIRVQALLNKQVLPATPLGTETPTNTLSRVRHLLLVPRQTLTYTIGPDILISSPSGANTKDVNNGPEPVSLSITQVGGTESLMIDYTIKTYLIECPATSPPSSPPNYLANRWKEVVTVDESFYSKKVRTGRILVRADMLSNADVLRRLVVPGIDPNFKRISSTYTLQEDGLALEYQYTDQEVYLQPPAPATEASGEYIESSPNNAVRFGEVRVKLKGSAATDKGALLQTAILIAVNKVRLGTSGSLAPDTFLKTMAVKEGMWTNEVEVHIRVQLPAYPARTFNLPMDLTRFTLPPLGSNPNQALPPDPGTRGTAGLLLVAQALRDPCLASTVSILVGGVNPVDLVGGTGNTPPASVTFTPVLPTDQNALYSALASSTLTSIYTDYVIDSRYEYDFHTFQMPIASSTAVTSAFVQVAPPTAIRVVDWTCERIGAKPALPALNLNDNGNSVPLRAWVSPTHTEIVGDGTNLKFRVTGQYVYGLKNAFPTAIAAGLPPYIDPSAANKVCYVDGDFVSGIIDTCLNQGGGVTLH